MGFGASIRQRRQELGIGLNDIAERLGVRWPPDFGQGDKLVSL